MVAGRVVIAMGVVLAVAGCDKAEPMAPRTIATRQLQPLGAYPNLSTVPQRPAPPTAGVARADETEALALDRGSAQAADRDLRATGPVPPPAADSVRPNLELLGAMEGRRRPAGEETGRRRYTRLPDGPETPADSEPVPELPSGPIASPELELPAEVGVTAATRLATRPAVTPPAPEAPAAAAPPVAAPSKTEPVLVIRFPINVTRLGAAGLARLDGFAQQWANTGRGRISLAARRDDYAADREAGVAEGLRRAGVPADMIALGRISVRPNAVELWRD